MSDAEARASREVLLRAARRTWAQQGLEAVSLDAAALKVGVPGAKARRLFEDDEGLKTALRRDLRSKVSAALEQPWRVQELRGEGDEDSGPANANSS
ncbi:hypothetical protein [Streptomyces chartreusis]|uniref:hypothetical protein n=1 Tax=Streptomyces chartreusis TaxID=1969 RepID=UPI0036A385AD